MLGKHPFKMFKNLEKISHEFHKIDLLYLATPSSFSFAL